MEMGKEMIENVNNDGELEMLLNEIPQATSHNLLHLYHRNPNVHDGGGDDHGPFVTQAIPEMCGMYDDDDDDTLTRIQYPCVSSPVSGFSLQSDGSSSSLFSAGHALSNTGTGSPTSPTLEDLKSTIPFGGSCHPKHFWLDSVTPNANESLVDEPGLCANLSQMYISNQQDNRLPFRDCSLSGNSLINVRKHGNHHNIKRGFLDCVGFQSPFPRSAINHNAEMSSALLGLGLTQDYTTMPNLFGSRQCTRRPETILSQINGFSDSTSMHSPRHRRQLVNNHYYRGSQAPEPTAFFYRNPVVNTNLRTYLSVQHLLQYSHSLSKNARAVPPSNARIPQGNIDAIASEGSFIIQGECLNYVASRCSDRSRCRSKAAVRGTHVDKHVQRSELDKGYQVVGTYENNRNARIDCSFPLQPKYNSLAEARGYVYLMAKDQHGCRFLQRVFDEGTPEDVEVIFNEIIDHVVELMMNPFGNYLMQKLLDVCNEQQRMQILLIITEEPGQLVRISLNTHGTRVIQKLIETLQTKQQVSLAVSALEPGFLALIKDLNGNHVVQRCLLCLSNEDNKFIFVAAAKYCIDIATHQHGCCVLQRCIGHSSGERREKLIAEISANALLLAQDQYGNYVIQFILDLRIPSATTSISLLFEGNYLHLSRQKFGSHVVEKCLAVFNDENRSIVIHELVSAPHFEHLLQDPHANYVVQSALRHSEGRVHKLLVEAVRSHKAFARNSPYSKKIFSQKLLKKLCIFSPCA